MNKEDDRIGICCSDEVVIVVKPDRPSLSMDDVIKQVQSPSTTFECKPSKQAAVGRRGGCKYISGVIWRLKSNRSWVAAMLVLGTADMLLNLVNFSQMTTSERLKKGMIIGPPSWQLWFILCLFTVAGTLLFFPETVNTLSALFRPDGDTVVPIHLELLATLCFEHIPLAALDYFITRTRQKYSTHVEAFCNSARIAFVSLRIVWYAHIEGKKIRKNDKYELQQVNINPLFYGGRGAPWPTLSGSEINTKSFLVIWFSAKLIRNNFGHLLMHELRV